MSKFRRVLRRTLIVLMGVPAALILGGGVAYAHVTIYSPDTVVAGGDAEIVLRTPNESDTASLAKVELDMPMATPLSNASPSPVPGWTSQVNMTKLQHPVKMGDLTVTDAVTSIVWTARRGAGTPPNDFQAFSFWSEGLPTNTNQLVFTAVQTYSDHTSVTWNQPTPPNGPEPEHPAPVLSFTSDSTTSDMSSPSSTPGTPGFDSAARWIAAGGVAVGALGVGIGVLRSSQSPPESR